ncbi:MAG: YbhB/YbcL family Raf kinase inhibitor-like protein [Ilumatobacteraceae bacterium]
MYTCDGSNTSPELGWAGLPSDTVETAVIVTDLDAEGSCWVVYSIDPSITNLALGQVPEGVSQAVNSFGNARYDGPCPPSGTTHAYLIEVYALGQQLEIPDGAPASEVIEAVQFASLAQVSLLGNYTRP